MKYLEISGVNWMKKKYKIIVSHPGQQHSFKTAGALKKEGKLDKYFTTVYLKKKSLTNLVKMTILKNEDLLRVNNRRCDTLDDEDVIQKYELLGLMSIGLVRLFKNPKIYELWNNWLVDIFARKVSRYAINNKVDAVISYDNNSAVLFKKLENKGIIRIMDVSAANRLFMQSIYKQDIENCGDFSNLYGKTQLIDSQKLINRYEDEIMNTDFFLVGSAFVKKSLEYSGINEDRIKIVPYGVDIEKFKFIPKERSENEDVRFLFVGNINPIKGIYYLLEAFNEIEDENIKLTLVGKFLGNEDLLAPYKEKSTFLGCVVKDSMPEIYANHDVLVFPSLGEGFGQVVLEAMACGLPVIVSENVGAVDSIEDGENGFIIPPFDIESIKDKVLWFNNNKKELTKMSYNARRSVESLSWINYEKKLVESLDDIFRAKEE